VSIGPRNIHVYRAAVGGWFWQCNRDDCYDYDAQEPLPDSDGYGPSWQEALDAANAHHEQRHGEVS
jgi:hypothetical protein